MHRLPRRTVLPLLYAALLACGAWLPAPAGAAASSATGIQPALSAPASAGQVRYESDSDVIGSARVEYLKDTSGRLTLAAVRSAAAHFQPVAGPTVNFGFSTAAYWLHLSVESQATQAVTTYLSIGQSTLDDIQFYVMQDGHLRQSARAGDETPNHLYPVPGTRPVLPLQLSAGARYELYVRVASQMGALLVPLRFESAADLQREARLSMLVNGGFTGLLGGLCVYNLFLFLMLRQRAYLYYALTLVAGYFADIALDGFGSWMLYPSLTWPANEGLVVCSAAGMALYMLLVRMLLETRARPGLDRLLLGIAVTAASVVLSPWLLPKGWAYPLDFALLLTASLAGLLAGALRLYDGYRPARFLLAAQLAESLSLLGFAMTIAGVLPFTTLGRHGGMIGSSLQAMLMSLALADRIRALQHATRRAERAARQALQHRHVELERSVEERTRELNEARRRAEYLATTDALTGVYNRRGLMPLFQQAVSHALQQATPLAVISFDLDHFKRVNDDFGHAEGDRVLCELVTLTRPLIHPTDLFGRTGGEEFMLVLSVPRERAVALAEKLRQQLEQQLRAGPMQNVVTASFGVVALGRRLTSIEALQVAADAALYRAKRQGRNRVETYDASSNQTTRTRAILQSTGETG